MDSPAGSQAEMMVTTSTSLKHHDSTVSSSSQPMTIMSTVGGHHHMETVSGDSDLDTEADPPDWRLSISQEVLATLSKKETKRQDVINGE